MSKLLVLAKGLIVGAVAGAAGSWVMNKFVATALARHGDERSGHGAQSLRENDRSRPGSDDPAENTVEALGTAIGASPSKGEKDAAAIAVHYLFGAATGALYGAAAEGFPAISAGYGLPYATAVWVGADLLALPALGLSKSPGEFAASVHAKSLAAHLVYGASTDAARRLVLKAIG